VSSLVLKIMCVVFEWQGIERKERQPMGRLSEKRLPKGSTRKGLGSSTSIRMDDVSVQFEVRNEDSSLGISAGDVSPRTGRSDVTRSG
jgi:hypothetical protein